jgi:hypothetical protein
MTHSYIPGMTVPKSITWSGADAQERHAHCRHAGLAAHYA